MFWMSSAPCAPIRASVKTHSSAPVLDFPEEDLAKRFTAHIGGPSGKRAAVFGLTYKPGTTTLRRSRSIALAERLRAEGTDIKLYDPHASAEDVAALTALPFFADPYEAAKDCDGIVIATPWPDFKELDFGRLAKACRANAVIFDAYNFLHNESEAKIKEAKLKYVGVGRGENHHEA
jgi:UDPglucose 6-dehydrogenase